MLVVPPSRGWWHAQPQFHLLLSSVLLPQNAESWREIPQPLLAPRHPQHLRRVPPRALALCAEASLQLTQVTTKTVSVLLLTARWLRDAGQYPLHAAHGVPLDYYCVSMNTNPSNSETEISKPLCWNHGGTVTTMFLLTRTQTRDLAYLSCLL